MTIKELMKISIKKYQYLLVLIIRKTQTMDRWTDK